MSRHFKAIIPLLGDTVKLEDIDTKKGFVGAYSYDINRPSLDQHVFLMYVYIVTPFFLERDARLKQLPTFRSRRTVHIKDFCLVCYTFGNNIEPIRNIISDSWLLDDKDKLRIFKFWNFLDDDINWYMLHPEEKIFGETFKQVVVPEWDCPKEERFMPSLYVYKGKQQKPGCS